MGEAFELGVRLHDLAPAPLEERLARAGKLGFSCVHLASKVVCKEYGIDASGLTRELAGRLREACERAGVRVVTFGCYRNLAVPEEDRLEAELAQYEACCRFARWLGCDVVGTETGRPDAGNRITEGRRGDAALESFVTGLRRAAAIARDEGVTLAIEPGWNEVVCTPERCRAVLDQAGDLPVGVIYDAVSLLHPTVVDDVGEVTRRMLELCGDAIRVLHAKDFKIVEDEGPLENGGLRGWSDGSGRRLVCHAAGVTGSFDFAPIAEWARARGGNIPCVIENSTPETLETSARYLRSL